MLPMNSEAQWAQTRPGLSKKLTRLKVVPQIPTIHELRPAVREFRLFRDLKNFKITFKIRWLLPQISMRDLCLTRPLCLVKSHTLDAAERPHTHFVLTTVVAYWDWTRIFASRSNTSTSNHNFFALSLFDLGYRGLLFASMINLEAGPLFADIL